MARAAYSVGQSDVDQLTIDGYTLDAVVVDASGVSGHRKLTLIGQNY